MLLASLPRDERSYSPGLRWLKKGSESPELVLKGNFAFPIVSPEGKWAVAAKAGRNGWSAPNEVVRIQLETKEVVPIDLPAADTFRPLAWIPDRKRVLLYRDRDEDEDAYF